MDKKIKIDKFYRRMRLLSGAEAYRRRHLSQNIYLNHDFDKINRIAKMDLNNLENPENLNKIVVQDKEL